MLKRSLLFSFLLASVLASSQDTVRFSIANDFGLVDYNQNIISNSSYLDPFFEKLYQLKKSKESIVNILHIGDSHIQADYLTHQVRQDFQREFGNAGRGFVVPAKVAQTNEPANYTSQSSNKWEAKRIVFPDQPLPIGLGGITIRSEEENASLKITLKNYPNLNYSFNKVTAFLQKVPRSFHVALRDSLNRDIAYLGSFTLSHVKNTAAVALPYSMNSIAFTAVKALPLQDRITYYGFNFENGNPGILYHAIGVNGAKYKHYQGAEDFAEQSKALNPDLIIIALGTNEALDHPYSDPKFSEYVSGLVRQLKIQNPDALFLISIHADSFRKKTKKNPGITEIRKKLLEYVQQNQLACYDLYEAGGGNHSAEKWRKAELLREDGVHFTRAGYELQGNMLYLALMNAYNRYVSDRRK